MLCEHCQEHEATIHVIVDCGGDKVETTNLCEACHQRLAVGPEKAFTAHHQEIIRSTPCKFCAKIGSAGCVTGGGMPGKEEWEVVCDDCAELIGQFLDLPGNQLPDFPQGADIQAALEWERKSDELNKAGETWIKAELARRRSKQ
jgi:protein-arginine kinase activator protein McsA